MGLWHDRQTVIVFSLPDKGRELNAPRISLAVNVAPTPQAAIDNGPRWNSTRFKRHSHLLDRNLSHIIKLVVFLSIVVVMLQNYTVMLQPFTKII
jgi:hypothetical protein